MATPDPSTERTLRSTARNPRRRQRHDSDSVKQQPTRKRSKISKDTFEPANGNHKGTMNGHVVRRDTRGSTPLDGASLAMRGKKGTPKRVAKGDGSRTLTENTNFRVSLLPSTPDVLRQSAAWRGFVDVKKGLALGITREHAYVWDYTAHAPVSNPRTFTLPFTTRATDPLPLGALVTAGASADVGLVLVSAHLGRICFWESVDAAASLSLFHERSSGIEGTVGSVFSGEFVQNITLAEHAGFIITMSSGRIALLTLRDTQGKAKVQVQFIRAQEQSSGSFFGSIKGLITGGGWKRDVVAVHVREPAMRGQVEILAATMRGDLQIWDIDWSGKYDFKGTVDMREKLFDELSSYEGAESQGVIDEMMLLDFAVLDGKKSTELTLTEADHPVDLLLLVRTGNVSMHKYAMVEVQVSPRGMQVIRSLPLNYSGQQKITTHFRPRLILPKPSHTAYVVFSDASVLVTTSNTELGPEAQLVSSYEIPEPYQDAIYLRMDKGAEVLDVHQGEAKDAKSGTSSCLAFVNGSGLVRIAAHQPAEEEEAIRTRVPAKSRIEQAVFNGALQDNIVDFSRKGGSQYSMDEVEAAALEFSGEILRSESPFIPPMATSMETHLTLRAKALEALVLYLRQNHPPLSQVTMWQLLWNAEKVAGAQELWRTYEEHLESGAKASKRQQPLFAALCQIMHERYKANDDSEENDEDDLVRKWFVKGVARIERLLPFLRATLRDAQGTEDADMLKTLRMTSEADDIAFALLETVFGFREENAAIYGIDPARLQAGVLVGAEDYAELPEIWTSSATMLHAIANHVGLSRDYTTSCFEKGELSSDCQLFAKKIAEEIVRLVQLACLVYRERIAWALSRDNDRDSALAHNLQVKYDKDRHDMIRMLAKVGQSTSAIKMAERYRDMQTLTELIVSESQYLAESEAEMTAEDDKAMIRAAYTEINQKVMRYFERYGDAWANAFFDQAFSDGRSAMILDQAEMWWKGPLRRYLRAEPSRAKVCWINDVLGEREFEVAVESLETAAEHESSLWAKKVELSLGKLMLLAAKEDIETGGDEMDSVELQHKMPDLKIAVIAIQESLYRHLMPTLQTALADDEMKVQVLMETFGSGVRDYTALSQLLEHEFTAMLDHRVLSTDEMVDVLTLMLPIPNEEDEKIAGSEFFLALQLLKHAAPELSREKFELLHKLVWKRCFLLDDWPAINSARKLSDEDVSDLLSETAAYRTLLHGYAEALFGSSSPVHPLKPSECLGAGCRASDWESRFQDAEIVDRVVADNQAQDEELQQFIDDRKLDYWIKACHENAKAYIDEQAEVESQRLYDERLLEGKMVKDSKMAANGNGNGNGVGVNGYAQAKVNGSANWSRMHELEEDSGGEADMESQADIDPEDAIESTETGDYDGEGDVDMA